MASSSLNKVIIIGNLGANPELRYTKNDRALAVMNIATSDSWHDKQTGNLEQRTEWHRCIAFRRLGEIAAEYLSKGSKVYIEGKLHTRKWTSADGKERYISEIIVSDMQMLSPQVGSKAPYNSDSNRTNVNPEFR